MKLYWLSFNPDTFIWKKKDKGLIYNCNNYKSYEFVLNNSIETLCDRLLNPDNLYSIEISEMDLKKMELRTWFTDLIKLNIATLTLVNEKELRPISYCPILKLQRDKNTIIWENDNGVGGRIIENLHELVFFVNGSDHGSNVLSKQTYFPIISDCWIKFSAIKALINSCRNGMLNKITFIGDFSRYPDHKTFLKNLPQIGIPVSIITSAEDFINNQESLILLRYQHITISLIITDFAMIVEVQNRIREQLSKIHWIFIVYSEEEYNLLIKIIDEFNLNIYEIVPIYNQKNLTFFEDNIYLTKNDLSNIELSKKEIFANMTLNTFFFGKLYIMPDGSVYSNMNFPRIGTLDSTIYNILFKEFNEGRSWLRIRDMKPCCDCVYQWLCPSPSDYELVIGKPNLCHIMP